jgi:hypothetical protein
MPFIVAESQMLHYTQVNCVVDSSAKVLVSNLGREIGYVTEGFRSLRQTVQTNARIIHGLSVTKADQA